MRTLTLALVCLLALAALVDAPRPAASEARDWRSPTALLDGDKGGGGDDDDEDDEDDDDEDVRALG